MAEGQLKVDIISPERPIFSGEAVEVTAPAHDGELGILPKHAPMVTELGIGEVRIRRNTLAGSVTEYFAIRKGFLETSGNKVILITERAKAPDEVDEQAVQADLEALHTKLAGNLDHNERKAGQEESRWLQALTRVARHSRKGMGHGGALDRSGLTIQMDKAEMRDRTGTKA